MGKTIDSKLIAKLAGIKNDKNLGRASGVAFNSARVKAGDVFFALAGEHSHGIKYADEALKKGALFVVSDKYHERGLVVKDPAKLLLDLGAWARARHKGNIIAVTGSAGKTSTKNFIAKALAIPKSPGNFNTPLALAKTLIENLIADNEDKDLVLELGIDHVGEMDQLLNLAQPDYAVLTLISASHLSGLKTVETVAKEKTKILKNAKLSLVSEDAIAWLEKTENIKTYGLFPSDLDYVSKQIKQDLNGQSLEFNGLSYKIPLLSSAMAKAATAALGLATELGYNLPQAAKNLATLRLEPRRLEIKKYRDFLLLDDSYNSSPAALIEAISVLKTLPKPHTAILGDMLELGPESAKLHREISPYLANIRLITVGKHAREFVNSKSIHFNDIEAAQEYLKTMDKSGSILLKASLGMNFLELGKTLEAQA